MDSFSHEPVSLVLRFIIVIHQKMVMSILHRTISAISMNSNGRWLRWLYWALRILNGKLSLRTMNSRRHKLRTGSGRKRRERNLPRASETTPAARVILLVLVASILLLLGRSMPSSTSNIHGSTSSATFLLPVVTALPELRKTPSLSSNVKRAAQRKVKGKIEKSLLKTKKKDSCDPKNKSNEKYPDEDGSEGDSDPEINTSNGDDDNTNSVHNRVTIESFLAPRRFPVRRFLRTTCLLLAVWSFLQCRQTSGIPYAQTVWQIVYGTSSSGDNAEMSSIAAAAASRASMDFVPTPMEKKLALMIISCNDDFNTMLPPEILPSAGPLLKFVASIVAYIGLTLLLPLWSTKFRVLLDYRKILHPSKSDKNSQKPSPRTIDQTTKNGDVSVLARLGSNLLVAPLHESSKATSNMDTSKKNQQKKKNTKKSKKKVSRAETGYKTNIENNDFVHPSDSYFEIDHSRIYCNVDTKECIDGTPALHSAPFSVLQRLVNSGGLTKQQRRIAKERYGPYATFPLATPTFQEAFLERISSPLVVIQLVGKLVSLLEEGTGAVISMCMTLAQHYYNAQQAITSATQLAEEVKTNLQDTSGYQVLVWRESKQRWISTTAGELVPGDVFRLMTSQNQDDAADCNKMKKQKELIIPVDALVITGQCLTNEAILTGESVPQIKIPFDFDQEQTKNKLREENDSDDFRSERQLDLHKDRSSILFAGTTLFHTLGGTNSTAESTNRKDATAGGVTCIALRTGTYSSKGRLLKALKGSARVGAISNQQSEKDNIRMIASLSCCAALSCTSLFVQRGRNVIKVSPFRRVIQCTRIALASVPSDLPLALASTARYCSKILRQQSDVVCSEPGSLLTAAYVDTVVFDKTGTLTADTQSLSKVVRMPSQSESLVNDEFQRCLLAGCHSLVHFEENKKTAVVGDPLDKAALQFSGWKYNQTADYFFRPESDSKLHLASEPIRLWQIRSIPFDPSRRLSSAIVLLQRQDSSLELWKFTKGSPDTMIDLIEKNTDAFVSEFHNRTQELEMQGFRCIALGAKNLGNSSIEHLLFPKGLSTNGNDLATARTIAEKLQRNAIDGHAPEIATSGLKFRGFCCFDASTRPSSKRVVNELVGGGLKCIMLTGDSVDAALSVAKKVEILKHRQIAILERSENSVNGKEHLVWKILRSKVSKDGSLRILHDQTRIEKVTASSVKKVVKYYEGGKYSLAANGRALEMIFSSQSNQVGRLITSNLAAMSVIARATPELKKQVIETLKKKCGKRVMMCGDGVNDVAAIQSADVAASLLTGFGTEKSDSGIDIDDKRRLKKIATMKIGSNRAQNVGNVMKQEANDRIRKEIERCREEIDKRASSRDSESAEVQYSFQDMKEMISATMRAARKERRRAEQLRKGGGDAARILAEERQRESATEKEDNDDESRPSIKPGEASLVSSFSCLHPSVDGIDAILREGIATAASALATQQEIGLHSLMACFHLATLYRDGLRYGKHMWNIEIFFYQILDNSRNKASCTPRPRLPNAVSDRPPISLFQFVSIFEILCQAIIHTSCMAMGVRYAKYLEQNMRIGVSEAKLGLDPILGSRSLKLGKLLHTLSKRSRIDVSEEERNSNPFFRRSPFRPNYETNTVFIFSILQSALSALVSHKGAPFHHSILESRDLCAISGITLLFVLVCITGKMSSITTFLEVKPLPSGPPKLVFLGLVMLNVIACVFCRSIVDNLLCQKKSFKPETKKNHPKNAADHEEKLLSEEAKYNLKGIGSFCGVVIYLMIDAILSFK